MVTKQLKQLYINFFQSKGHSLIPSASLVPENDPTVLFTTAGMHPLTPYIMGERHPQGKRLVNAQKCIRTNDIDDVGDATHLTFFEMLGNWSFGDYFKKEAIEWSYEFLTSKKYLGFDPTKLHVTVFAGEEGLPAGRQGIPRDDESAKIWQSLGIPKERIYFLPHEDNFWGPAGETGPCGPDTEMFIDTGKPKHGPDCRPGCGCGKYFEIWNDVFMEYEKTRDGKYVPLKQKNVDTGMGLERTVAMLNGYSTVYEIDTLEPLMTYIRQHARNIGDNEKSVRIIVDHLRASVFLLADERQIRPSNVDQGYILRRLIRRMIRHAKTIGFDVKEIDALVQIIVREHHVDYPELARNHDVIIEELHEELDKFSKTLEQGIRAFEKYTKSGSVSGNDAFILFSSYGFPLEMIQELANEKKITVNTDAFNDLFKQHQQRSRTAAAGKFKGGLADHSEMTVKYHTANHLLLEALKLVLGRDAINQKGSNITPERLRFDFSYSAKLTPEQIKKVEDIVNTEIAKGHEVHFEEMSAPEAKKAGATGVFEHKYGDKVKVYFVGDFSKEICGGPHVKNTRGMGHLKIIKEEASSAGVRRIKAIFK